MFGNEPDTTPKRRFTNASAIGSQIIHQTNSYKVVPPYQVDPESLPMPPPHPAAMLEQFRLEALEEIQNQIPVPKPEMKPEPKREAPPMTAPEKQEWPDFIQEAENVT